MSVQDPKILVPTQPPLQTIPEHPPDAPRLYGLHQEPGVIVVRDAIRPTEQFLRGKEVYVDHEAGYIHLPKYDLEGQVEVGYTNPLVVFLVTNEHFIGIKPHTEFKVGVTGVYTVPKAFAPLYRHHASMVIDKKGDLKVVRETNNAYRAVAEIVCKRYSFKNQLRGFFFRFLKTLKLATAFGVALTV